MSEKNYQMDKSLIEPGCPIVTLAGREWFVPTLALRQSRIVLPLLMRILPDLAEFESNQAPLSEDNFESIITVVHGALTRAYPALTRDEFLDLPISTSELIGALPPIICQAGYFNLAVEASSDA